MINPRIEELEDILFTKTSKRGGEEMKNKITVYYDFDEAYSVLLNHKKWLYSKGSITISKYLYAKFNKAEKQYWTLADKITEMIKAKESQKKGGE